MSIEPAFVRHILDDSQELHIAQIKNYMQNGQFRRQVSVLFFLRKKKRALFFLLNQLLGFDLNPVTIELIQIYQSIIVLIFDYLLNVY